MGKALSTCLVKIVSAIGLKMLKLLSRWSSVLANSLQMRLCSESGPDGDLSEVYCCAQVFEKLNCAGISAKWNFIVMNLGATPN